MMPDSVIIGIARIVCTINKDFKVVFAKGQIESSAIFFCGNCGAILFKSKRKSLLVSVHACNFQGVVSYLGVCCIVSVACTVNGKRCVRSNIDLNATVNLGIVFNTGDERNNRNREGLGVSTVTTNNKLIVSYGFNSRSVGVGVSVQLQGHSASNDVRSE